MRIWSLHPRYLDAKGLVALWREALLAKHVLAGRTKGYKNHPQLHRFKNCDDPLAAINRYLMEVYSEAETRGYHFSREKIDWASTSVKIPVTVGQLKYEATHLLNKLMLRDKNAYHKFISVKKSKPHPMFTVINGEIENWENIQLKV